MPSRSIARPSPRSSGCGPPIGHRKAFVPDQRHADQCRLVRVVPRWKVGVGVSIDGPRELHDAHRKTRSGKGTFDKTIAGIRCLRATGAVPRDLGAVARQPRHARRAAGLLHLRRHRPRLLQRRGVRGRPRLRAVRRAPGCARATPPSCAASGISRGRAAGYKFVREIDLAMPRVFRPEGSAARATSRSSRWP